MGASVPYSNFCTPINTICNVQRAVCGTQHPSHVFHPPDKLVAESNQTPYLFGSEKLMYVKHAQTQTHITYGETAHAACNGKLYENQRGKSTEVNALGGLN
jgi:hypothetical protein